MTCDQCDEYKRELQGQAHLNMLLINDNTVLTSQNERLREFAEWVVTSYEEGRLVGMRAGWVAAKASAALAPAGIEQMAQ